MTGAIEILRASDGANSRSFIITRMTNDTIVFYAEDRTGGEQYDIEALVTEPPKAEQWVVAQNNVNADFQRVFTLAPQVIHRITRADANDDFAVHAQNRLGELDIVFGPSISDATARALSVANGETETQDTLRNDFDLPRAREDGAPFQYRAANPYRWSAVSSSANATVAIDPLTGVMQVTGVTAGAATITVTVEDGDTMRASKTLNVTVT